MADTNDVPELSLDDQLAKMNQMFAGSRLKQITREDEDGLIVFEFKDEVGSSGLVIMTIPRVMAIGIREGEDESR